MRWVCNRMKMRKSTRNKWNWMHIN